MSPDFPRHHRSTSPDRAGGADGRPRHDRPGSTADQEPAIAQVELVAIRVGHDHPADLALADIDPAGAEGLQPGDFGGLVTRAEDPDATGS